MPLLELWENSKENILEKNIQQIVSFAGDGKLKDGSQCSMELREFLEHVSGNMLKSYATFCLETPFADSGFVLQDIVNEAGRRLGYEVENGIYRGRKQHNNRDGLWKADRWTFVTEVKTTDTYPIELKKIANYLHHTTEGKMGSDTSCLIVVGRKDTDILEDQLRGSRYNWDMRIVGVEALFKALELKEQSDDPLLAARIIELFKPQEFTRIDKILSIAFDFATDREEAVLSDDPTPEDETDEESTQASEVVLSEKETMEALKLSVVEAMSEKCDTQFTRRSRSSFENKDKNIRLIISASKFHKQASAYWFGFKLNYMNYLTEADKGFFVTVCLNSRSVFVLPTEVMRDLIKDLKLTIYPYSGEIDKYHVHIKKSAKGHYIHVASTDYEFDVEPYRLKIGDE